MQLKPILFMTSGLLLAAATVQVVAPVTQTILIAAAVDMPFGAEFRAEDLTSQSWPIGMAPAAAFDDAGVLFSPPGSPPRR